jgi:hypothetical protein
MLRYPSDTYVGGKVKMFLSINGVQIRELEITKDKPNIDDKQFEIEYVDNVFVHKLVRIHFMKVNVKGGRGRTKHMNGQQWMFIIMDSKSEFDKRRKAYAELSCMIHDKIGDYLADNYNYNTVGIPIIIDSMETIVSRPVK